MKKLVSGIFVVGILIAALVVYSSLPEKEPTPAGPTGADLYAAIRAEMETFETSLGADIDLLAPGEKTAEATWNFRGSLKDQAGSKPFFGTIRSVCASFSDSECWQLVTLSVDGLSVFSEDAVLPTSRLAGIMDRDTPKIELTPVDNVAEQQEVPAQEETPPLETAAAVEGEPEPEEPKALPPREIWHTSSDNVNGRMGPGTEYDVAFKIPVGLNLTLLERNGDWGLFKYPANNGKDGKIWIYMPLVEQQ